MKWIKLIICILLPIMALFASTVQASARDDLYITDWTVEAQILENGDLSISEDISFEFNKKYNGVYRDIYLNKTSGVSDIKVQEIKDGRPEPYMAVEKAKNGSKGVYTTEESKEKIHLKIYSPSENETKTFRISYTVKNVAIKYSDIAELYYSFIGKQNETAIGRLLINLYLPAATDDARVKLFAHGPINGRIEKIDNRHYQLRVQELPANKYVEGRILFPVELIARSGNIQEGNRYQSILDEEAAYQNELARESARNEAFRNFFKIVNPIAFLLGLAVIVFAIGKCKREPVQNQQPVIMLEKECTPAMASMIAGRFSGINVVFATILDLFRKGYISLNREQDDVSVYDNQAFIINKEREADKALQEHEKYLMDWFFFRIGAGKRVSTRDIEEYSRKNKAKFIEEYNGWRQKIKSDLEKKGCYDKSKKGLGGLLLALSIAEFIIGILTAASANAAALLTISIGAVMLIYGLKLFTRLSDYGYEIYRRLMNIKSHIRYHSDYSNTDKNPPDTSLIYALAIGILPIKPRVYGEEASLYMNNWVLWYFIFASPGKNNNLRKCMDSSFAPVVYAGGGEAFTDGGGAAAGGGGAGGF